MSLFTIINNVTYLPEYAWTCMSDVPAELPPLVFKSWIWESDKHNGPLSLLRPDERVEH
jgi:hypothetical protein